MSTTDDLKIRAGDTDPKSGQSTTGASAEVTDSDISSGSLYARKKGEDSNHIDGASLTIDSVDATDNGAGETPRWSITINWTFDPVSNGPDGNNAWDSGDHGTYDCYTRFVYTDGDISKHPAEDETFTVTVAPDYE